MKGARKGGRKDKEKPKNSGQNKTSLSHYITCKQKHRERTVNPTLHNSLSDYIHWNRRKT